MQLILKGCTGKRPGMKQLGISQSMTKTRSGLLARGGAGWFWRRWEARAPGTRGMPVQGCKRPGLERLRILEASEMASLAFRADVTAEIASTRSRSQTLGVSLIGGCLVR